jgi:hypothetical protein
MKGGRCNLCGATSGSCCRQGYNDGGGCTGSNGSVGPFLVKVTTSSLVFIKPLFDLMPNVLFV